MHLLFAADVFGITPEFMLLCQDINQQYNASVNTKADETCFQVIGPYQDDSTVFTDEQQAYQYFSQQVGLNQYAERLKAQLDLLAEATLFVGFSVGGSALWQISAELKNTQLVKAVCLYSSQIRHNTNIAPTVPVSLILPAVERHFSVDDLAISLQATHHVTIIKSKYLHGFMNALSDNYNVEAAREYCSNVFV